MRPYSFTVRVMFTKPAPMELLELVGKVVDELVKGYYLNDKIIRHAKVVVGK